MRVLDLDRDIKDFCAGLIPKHAKQIVLKIFDLAVDVRPHDSKHLKGWGHCFEVTSGEYRVIYTFTPTAVRVLLVGKRNGDEVFKDFDRKFKNLVFAA